MTRFLTRDQVKDATKYRGLLDDVREQRRWVEAANKDWITDLRVGENRTITLPVAVLRMAVLAHLADRETMIRNTLDLLGVDPDAPAQKDPTI